MSINNKPIVVLVYLQHAGWFFFPQFGKWNYWNTQKCYLKINQRQQAGGCPGQGKEVTAS